MIDALTGLGFGALLVVLRASALVVAVPAIGTRSVPARFKLTLAALGGYGAFVGAGAPAVAAPASLGSGLALVLSETAVGLCAGLCARVVLEAGNAIAQTAAMGLGLGFSSLVDPLHGAESNVLGQLVSILATAVAVALGIHREAFVWLAFSVRDLPPGTLVDLPALASGVVTQATGAIALAVRVGFPLFTAVLLGHLALGLMGRAAPQLNLSSIGFSVSVFAGGAALYLLVPTLVRTVATAAVGVLAG